MTKQEMSQAIDNISEAYQGVIGAVAEWAETGSLKPFRQKAKIMEDLIIATKERCAD